MFKYNTVYKISTAVLIFVFLGTFLNIPQTQAGQVFVPAIPVAGTPIALSKNFTSAHLQGLAIHPNAPFTFDFLIDPGQEHLGALQKEQEYTKLIKYFLASLTVPDKDQWVNLSPYEHDRIIGGDFGKTQMGRDLLEEDYVLKQIISGLMYPKTALGKEFWNKVYAAAWAKYHTTSISINTFNKVWIVPDQAAVYESGNTVYVLRNHLKVMLEEDYLALKKNNRKAVSREISSQIIREIILPVLENEVNQGKNFAPLRQMYSAMILAVWYKQALKESLLGKVYTDKTKIKGIQGQGGFSADKIYQQYLIALKKGVFNYIAQDKDQYTNRPIVRKYFAGGMVDFASVSTDVSKGFEPATVLVINNHTDAAQMPESLSRFLKSDLAASTANTVDRATASLELAKPEEAATDWAMTDTGVHRLEVTPSVHAFIQQLTPTSKGSIRIWFHQKDAGIAETSSFAGLLRSAHGAGPYMDIDFEKVFYRPKVSRLEFRVRDGLSLRSFSMNPAHIQSIEQLTEPAPKPIFLDTHILPVIDLLEIKEEIKARTKDTFRQRGIVTFRDLIKQRGNYPVLAKLLMDKLGSLYPGIKNLATLADPTFDPVSRSDAQDSAMASVDRSAQILSEMKIIAQTAQTQKFAADPYRSWFFYDLSGLTAYARHLVLGSVGTMAPKDGDMWPLIQNNTIKIIFPGRLSELQAFLNKLTSISAYPDFSTFSAHEQYLLRIIEHIADFREQEEYVVDKMVPKILDNVQIVEQGQFNRRKINIPLPDWVDTAVVQRLRENLQNVSDTPIHEFRDRKGSYLSTTSALTESEIRERLQVDKAMLPVDAPGGIDFNAQHFSLEIKRDGNRVPLPFEQQDLAQLNQIQGFVPRILEIRPFSATSILVQLQQKLSHH